MRWPKKKRYVILLMMWSIFVLLGLKLGVDLWQLNGVKDEFRAQGFPMSPEELREWTKLPEGTPNAAPLVEQAIDALDWEVLEDRCVPVVGDCDVDLSDPFRESEIRDDTRIALEANAESLTLLRETKNYESFSRDRSYNWNLYVPMDFNSNTRHMARLLYVDALYQVEMANTPGALEDVETMYSLARFLYLEPDSISWLVANAIDGMADGALRRLIKSGPMADDDLIVASSLVERSKSISRLDYYAIGESAMAVGYTDPSSWLMEALLSDEAGDPLNVPALLWGHCIDLFTFMGEQREYLEFMSGVREVALLPVSEGLAAYEKLYDRMSDGIGGNFMIFMGGTSHDMVFRQRARSHMLKDMIILGIQVERYWLATGELPGSVDELIPKYMKTVPVSPYDQKPLAYEPFEGGFWVGCRGTERWDTHVYDVVGDGEESEGQPYVRKFGEAGEGR